MPTEGINPHELMKILLYGSQEHTDPQGVLPFISHIGMCRPKGWGFVPFWSENGYRFCPYWSGIGYGLQGNYDCVSTCSSFQFQRNKKESVI